jgi:hypothetical protein
MEFIGDSITVGACNEDGDADQWENRRTHNAAMSYAALTAEAFSADHRNIAVSGMGVGSVLKPAKSGIDFTRNPHRHGPISRPGRRTLCS